MSRQIELLRRFSPEICCWGLDGYDPRLAGVPVRTVPFPYVRRRWTDRWRIRLALNSGGNFVGPSRGERRWLERELRESRPAVILAHFGSVALRVVPVARRLGIPLIAHFHGVDASACLQNPWYRWSLRTQVRNFAAVVVVAEYQRRAMIALGAASERVHVIPCGVPFDEVKPAKDAGRTLCQFIAVGRMVAKKAPAETIRAFAHCVGCGVNARLVVIGDGPLLTEVRALADSLGVGRRVAFRGSRASAEVMTELAQSSVFVQHSVTSPAGDREGWSVSIAEAMAAGLPVVATREGSIVDQVVPGETGFLVGAHDWRGMGSLMAELALDPDLRRLLGGNGRERARRHFEQRDRVVQLEAVLAQAIGRRRGTIKLPAELGRTENRPVEMLTTREAA